jgi:hypothetical protein
MTMPNAQEIATVLRMSIDAERYLIDTAALYATTEDDLRSMVMSALDLVVIHIIETISEPRHFDSMAGVHHDHVRAGLRFRQGLT